MPTTLPIAESELPPSREVLYKSLGSIDIVSGSLDPSLSSLDITSETERSSLASIDIVRDTLRASLSSISIGSFSLAKVLQSIDIVNGDSFVILVDVLQEELAGPNLGSYGQVEINAQLLVNGVEVPIKSFNFNVPTGKLGSTLNCVLADPSVAPVPAGASIEFNLVVTLNSVPHYYNLMTDGKLQERSNNIKYKGGQNDGPVDEVSFGATDVIADKFGLAPRRPVIMFDPSRVNIHEINTRQQDAIRQENGAVILPVIEPIVGLSMRQIISRAYTGSGGYGFITSFSPSYLAGTEWGSLMVQAGTNQQGCGFDSIITNIPDYRVRRADFSIESGWHNGAQPCLAMYDPLYFVQGSKLFIIDVDRALPFGALPHQLTLGDHKSLSERIAFKPDTNAVLLTYQYAANDPSEDPSRQQREVFTEHTDESGSISDEGYSKTTTRRWDYELFLAEEPTNVLLTLPKSIEVETQQMITTSAIVDDEIVATVHGVRTTHQEVTDYVYENELLVNSHKVTKAIVSAGVGASMVLIDVENENTHIIWTDDPYNPGNKLQDRVITDVEGAVMASSEIETVETPSGPIEISRRFPILLAQSSGILGVDNIVNLDMVPISSIRKTLHRLSDNQFNVNVVETDYLNNTVKRSYADPVTGTNSTSQYGSKSRTILLRDLDSETAIGPRIPASVNAYELPRVRALELGRNAMKRIKNPLQQMPIDLPGVDFVIARGSIVSGQRRSGAYTTNYFVTGYSITGQNLGKQGHRINQSLEAIELLTV